MTEKRFNCHVKFSAMPNGIMVLDYERHGDEQTVIEDISREKAHRVMDRLNELHDEKTELQKENEELKRKVKHFKELWAETSMENAELREKIDKSNKRFVEKLNTIQKQWG